MSHRHVAIPLAMRPFAGLSRFLFRIGHGDWIYRLIGSLMAVGERVGGVNVFGKYVPTSNDVIIACNSRSGTHWMMQIALQIAYLGHAEYDYIYDIVAWPDFLPGVALGLTDTPPASPTGLRVIKTHAPAHAVPINDDAHYITVIRDPKEVLASTFHWAPQAFAFLGLQSGTPEYWVEKFLKKQIPGGWWCEHTASWWAQRDKPNVHILTFNDLIADANTQIERISEFLHISLTEDQLGLVAEKSSFGYMKAINHKFSPIIGDAPTMDIVRQGQAGSGSQLFTPEQLATVDEFCKTELQRLGSDFSYEDVFVTPQQ